MLSSLILTLTDLLLQFLLVGTNDFFVMSHNVSNLVRVLLDHILQEADYALPGILAQIILVLGGHEHQIAVAFRFNSIEEISHLLAFLQHVGEEAGIGCQLIRLDLLIGVGHKCDHQVLQNERREEREAHKNEELNAAELIIRAEFPVYQQICVSENGV